MTREQVIVTQLRITKAGQSKHFQVRLPKNCKSIIGIEVGVRLIKFIKTEEAPIVDVETPI